MIKGLKHLLVAALSLCLLTSCSGDGGVFDKNNEINVISREEGSGTRGAFIDIFKIEWRGENGSKKDMTTKEASTVSKTDVMLSGVAGDAYAIGYVSIGSVSDAVRAVSIDSIQPSSENIKNGTYIISRPFNIATKGATKAVAKDFIHFILSAQGQEVVSKSYFSVSDYAPAYDGEKVSGKIVVAGSSSVTPIMEKLKEAYMVVNPDATIEIQMSDSTSGMTGVVDGTCDIGMASRELKDSEKEQLTATPIAIDGIAVIVNKENTITDLTKEQVKQIFTGETIHWGEIDK